MTYSRSERRSAGAAKQLADEAADLLDEAAGLVPGMPESQSLLALAALARAGRDRLEEIATTRQVGEEPRP